jgi:hypothetical protein
LWAALATRCRRLYRAQRENIEQVRSWGYAAEWITLRQAQVLEPDIDPATIGDAPVAFFPGDLIAAEMAGRICGGIELMSMSLCGAGRSSPGEQQSIKPPTRLIALSFSTSRCKDASLTLVGTVA